MIRATAKRPAPARDSVSRVQPANPFIASLVKSAHLGRVKIFDFFFLTSNRLLQAIGRGYVLEFFAPEEFTITAFRSRRRQTHLRGRNARRLCLGEGRCGRDGLATF